MNYLQKLKEHAAALNRTELALGMELGSSDVYAIITEIEKVEPVKKAVMLTEIAMQWESSNLGWVNGDISQIKMFANQGVQTRNLYTFTDTPTHTIVPIEPTEAMPVKKAVLLTFEEVLAVADTHKNDSNFLSDLQRAVLAKNGIEVQE
jgi:hypothetical protein